ncbi:unnamed protein product [Bursaphelenchus okinawaensis]|uniref:D-2-hydroxyglutarate dehydrogenase, mitochondrial n=1 Tax=Bursaphelenchus okinawaensis TaxID=465554 RepID=A0A811KAU6_9BILA|nr:unnamed protein product [Bursaphelenchus okinawaensis]CAG9096809.1 unnamed protein product [Bursaphelenchus okinawaensis]
MLAKRLFSDKAVARGDYGRLEDKDLNVFEKICGSNNVLKDDLDPYNVDFMKWYKGKSQCVLTPESAEQISQLLKHCYERRLAVCPQAGNTGLVGGSVPVHDEVVISIKKLRNYYKLDPNSGILECDAGFVLQELDEKLAKDGFMMPIDLGAKGSCLIGGNIATNAGGVRLVRYGSLNANVLSLQVVLPDAQGTILNLGAPLRKDNADLKLQQLFIGSEGQLGLITKCAILVPPKPKSVQLAFLGTKSFADCCAVLRACKKMLGEILSSFELMDSESMRCVEENVLLESVLTSKPEFNLLIEVAGSSPEHDAEKMENFLTYCMDEGLATDGVMAQTGKESELFWKIRENASLALNFDGYVYKHDVSLPLDHFYELSEVIRDRLKGTKAKRIVTFGHLGDGNSHLNITAKDFNQEVYDKLYPFIYDWTAAHNGSISAEHGIGRLKRIYHHNLVNEKKQNINSEIKRVFDPRGILSPYKMID